ncbi:MAG: DNA double-strand break repair nuclease NurA [Dehalococcoidia bacterium]|nr:DNA double-strand break repair nuclease NurA [Dehalococcoidia bacterium]
MSLDLRQITPQIEEMADNLRDTSRHVEEQVAKTVEVFHDQGRQFDRLKAKIVSSKGKTTWLVAGLKSGLDPVYDSPKPLGDYVTVGVDGSQIGVDRHSPVQCCLINVGACLLQYGAQPQARLESKPVLYFRDEDLFIDSPTASTVRQRLEGPVFAAKREIVALRYLVDLVKDTGDADPVLALLDASLILWQLGGKNIPDFVRDRLVGEEFLPCLDELREIGVNKRLMLASYISSPGSTDVVNALRVGICPFEPSDCNRHCPPAKGRQCSQMDGVQDRDLFGVVLAEIGTRSEVFVSPSLIVQDHYREHEVHFFYVNVGPEIARVEVPRWVADDEDLLSLTHGLVFDQARRGHGYPVALTEAHEQAVVSAADRESFWLIVDAELGQRRIIGRSSEKSRSKIIRGV